jgi:hypothetical protein
MNTSSFGTTASWRVDFAVKVPLRELHGKDEREARFQLTGSRQFEHDEFSIALSFSSSPPGRRNRWPGSTWNQ